MRLLCDELYGAVPKWYAFGLSLGLKSDTLDIIREDFNASCEQRMMKMLQKWLHTDPNASWEKIVRALCSPSVDYVRLSEMVRLKHCL